jgi:hypothetical protein
MTFSSRLEASKGKRALILEDAPRRMRIGYIKGILGSFVGSGTGFHPRSEPLDTVETHQSFIVLIRDEADTWDYGQESAWGALAYHLMECPWAQFYDFVELLGGLLLRKEFDGPFESPEYFQPYQSKVNSLFQEDGIGWTLTDKSELYRQLPKSLATRVKASEALLTDKFDTARIHYQKSLRYLHLHPIDEANSIKEIVSALESVSRVVFPTASTLGHAVKLMRKDGKYASHLIDALEKLYIFSNATPLIRHGHAQFGSPLLAEAELALFVGAAYIRYIIETSKRV